MSSPNPPQKGSTGGHFWTMLITLALAIVLVPLLEPLVQPAVIRSAQSVGILPTSTLPPRPTASPSPTATPVPPRPLTTEELSEAARASIVRVERYEAFGRAFQGFRLTAAMTLTLPLGPTATPTTTLPGTPNPGTRLSFRQRVDSGAGVVYAARDNRAYILTSARVVTGGVGSTVQVTPAGAEQARPARLLAISHCDDLAMLVVDDPGGLTPIVRPGVVISGLPVQPIRPTGLPIIPNVPLAPVVNLLPRITLGNSADVRPGQELIAFGFSSGDLGDDTGASQPTVITGVVSAGDVAWQQHPNLVRFAGLSGPGYAGGPVINREGQLIGITTFALTQGEGIAYAISIDHARAVADQLLRGINPHWTGLSLETRREPDGSLATVVDQVQADSPAAKAGLQPGDILVNLNGRPLWLVGNVCTGLRQRADGEQFTLSVQRTLDAESTTQELTFTITLGQP